MQVVDGSLQASWKSVAPPNKLKKKKKKLVHYDIYISDMYTCTLREVFSCAQLM